MPAPDAAYESESVVETTDYYPWGAQRMDTKAGEYGGEQAQV